LYEYFEILKDTLILSEVPAWAASKKRKPIVSSKYYFFDVGVVSSLQGRAVVPRSPEFGVAFETYLFHELRSHADYESGQPLAFWRSTSGYEVDFLIGDHTAIEVKGKEHVGPQDLRALRALGEERAFKRLICVSLEARRRKVGEITILPYGQFLDRLWDGEYS
jgi:predicted AAA+ superfamily ATPase